MGDYGHDVEFGVFIQPAAQSADQVVALSVLAEEAGFDLVTFTDHPYSPHNLDALTLMAFVAARTGRVRLAANVLNLPLRPPAVLARSVASLDLLSRGRAELGIGAGIAWDGIEAMGGRRLGPGDSVEALEEGIHIVRQLWDAGERDAVQFEGKHYRLGGARRGPAPAHDIPIWVGAFKPRMLRLVGRLADGWLPTLVALKPGDLAAGNVMIDAAAAQAGRDPHAIRRLLNIGAVDAPARETAAGLVKFALEDGIATFIVSVDDPNAMANFASEVAPRVREAISEARARGTGVPPAAAGGAPVGTGASAPAEAKGEIDDERLGVTPTPEATVRLSDRAPWNDSTRPRRDRSSPAVTYTDEGRGAAKQLIEVHDILRGELSDLRDILQQVRDGAMRAGDARAALNEMALRQNDWALGAFCARYCGVVALHHRVEDLPVFPHLAGREPDLKPVIDRLTEEHQVIHDAIEEVDRALVQHMARPENHDAIQGAIDYLTDALLSHLAYEEQELVEPLARLGFYPDKLPGTS